MIALAAAALFLGSCLLARGGLLDAHRYGDVGLYAHYAHEMASGRWPYGDFFDEYPPLAQPLFLLARLLPGPFHETFKWVMALCGAAAVGLLVAVTRSWVAAVVAGLSPLLVGPVLLNTYDLFPSLLVIGAVVALLRGRERPSYVLLGLAIAAKVYPLVLLPLFLLERPARRVLAWVGAVVVLVHLPFLIVGAGGLRHSYTLQLTRGLEVESLFGGVLLVLDRLGLHRVTLADVPPGSRDAVGALPDALATLSSIFVVVAVLSVARLYARGRRDLLLAAAAAVTAFVALNKVISPQYVAWLIPLVPAAGVAAGALLVAVLVLTHLELDRFLVGHGTVEAWGDAMAWWIFARNVVLVALLVLLVVRLRAGARSRSRP